MRSIQHYWRCALVHIMAALMAITMLTVFGVSSALAQDRQERPKAEGQRQTMSEEQVRFLAELAERLTELEFNDFGVPSWMTGDLGPASKEPEEAAQEAIQRLAPAFRIAEADRFEPQRTPKREEDPAAKGEDLPEERDEEGQAHVRLQQYYSGLPVVGRELIVHIDGERVSGINGEFVPDLKLSIRPRLEAKEALAIGLRELSLYELGELSRPQLVVFITDDGLARLAWSQKATYSDDAGDFQRDEIFADAENGRLLGRRALVWRSKFRQIYNGGQQCLNYVSQLPGTFMFDETVSPLYLFSSTDDDAKGAFFGTGKSYDFYKQVFSRSSYDGADSPLVSSVHFKFGGSCSPNNAAWINDALQMAYGDGDGSAFGPLATSIDVTAHELTHGVTSSEANLDYEKESGALNEGLSDILGEAADAFFQGGTPDWMIGEDVYTPGTPGDALRYMDDPTLDGYSTDYYPDRLYPGSCNPSPANDRCGVHGNSGIANLAFQLMSAGGTHPQGKTSNLVPIAGIEQARLIFYRALRDYMTPTTNFAGARKATANAASAVLQCKSIRPGMVDAVHEAWDAVGVPNTSQNGFAILKKQLVAYQRGGLSFPSIAGPNPPGPYNPCIFKSSLYNLVGNYGFQSGNILWTATSGVITNSSAQPGHASQWGWPSSWKAWLGGDGTTKTETLRQQVTIPSFTTQATFSYWLHVDTAESGGLVKDQLTVELRDPADNVLVTLDTFSNLDAASGYVFVSSDVTAYAGQTVRIYFKSTENATNQTSFVVDDVYLNVK